MTKKLKVTNLTDKPSAKAKQHRMVDLKVFVGTKALAPGESTEIDNDPVALAMLNHLKNVEAISIEEVKAAPPSPPPAPHPPTVPAPPPPEEQPEEEVEPEAEELGEEDSELEAESSPVNPSMTRKARRKKAKKSRRG